MQPCNLGRVYSLTSLRIGLVLSRYKSGPLPKAFRVLPNLAIWPTLLNITQPEEWSPHSVMASTRIFISSLEPKEAQKYLSGVLLPRFRREVLENKKVPPQIYMAMKKAVFKPAAFFKGILFPLCNVGYRFGRRTAAEALLLTTIQSTTCTLREAVILGSVISKASIPVLHSAAAILKLCEMPYSGDFHIPHFNLL
jgi:essential nuclear protein 1